MASLPSHKIAAGAFFLLLYCVASSPTLYSNGNRRNLHEPLYPIQWTPPSPIPEVSTPPAPSTDTPSPPAAAVQTASPIAASTTNPHPLSTFAKLAIGVSASVCAVAILSISAYFLTRRRATIPPESRKLIGDSRLFPPPDRQIAVSDFLYLGTMEPVIPPAQRLSDASDGSPYRKLGEEIVEVCHPSPELQPLPPLAGRDVPPAPPPLDGTTATGSSDEDDTFYTSKLSVASRNSESSGSPRSRRRPHTFLAGKDVPMSRRTSPRKQLSEYSPSDVKHAISPHHPPPPPPPPPPIPLPAFKKEESVKLPPFFIKTPIFGTINRDLHEVPSSPVPSSRRQLLRPLPPEDAARARVRSPIVPFVNDGCTSSSPPNYETEDDLSNEVKPTLKPLHWEKVQGSIDREMVWDHLKSDSFPLNEDMIETLFVNNSMVPSLREQSGRTVHLPPLKQEYRVLEPKKSQNIAILLRALNVTREEVSEALLDGNADGLGAELFETLMKMAPTKEEELKLRDYNGDTSKLGSAERFLKAILSIPYAFKRVDVMLYRTNFEAEVKYLWSSFETVEAACEDLKNSKLFLKLLEAVLRTGIRMNVGTNRSESKAFKLDTLLKLADVKGSDRKTTILHFVVQEITRTEGLVSESAAENQQGLKAVASLSTELGNVKKAAGMDSIVLNSYLSKLVHGLENIRSVLQLGDSCDQGRKFFDNTKTFLQEAEQEIGRVKSEEKKALNRIRELTEYFQGDVGKEEAHPLRIFVVVRDFLAVLDNVCKDVGRLHERAITSSAKSFRVSESLSLPVLHRFVPKPTTSVSNEASSSP